MMTDILILGAGLAGMRAALAALEENPALSVHVVSLGHKPGGSSFANRNNRLGMRVPLSDKERERTLARILEVAGPGEVDERLAALLCEEAEARFRELVELGLHFASGEESRVHGCFGGPQTAVIFDDLPTAFTRMRTRAAELGAKFVTSHEVMGLVTEPDRPGVTGCWLASLEDGRMLCAPARAVVVALGGPAQLISGNIAGRGVPGNAYALLAEAGARMANTRFLQCMWTSRKTGGFRSPAHLLQPGATVRAADGSEHVLNDEPMLALARERETHCPASYGLEDAALDSWLLERADAACAVGVKPPMGAWDTVYLAAHAGNGGAFVDENAFTGVPGLYACGECATGMHGANRLGGAMVTAPQVFGRRAGRAAAISCSERRGGDEAEFHARCTLLHSQLPPQSQDDFELLDEIGDGLQAHVLYQDRGDAEGFRARLDGLCAAPPTRRVELAAKAARILAG
ncbi:MAG: FAD-binding protein [Desulfovibrionaceae bacterium]